MNLDYKNYPKLQAAATELYMAGCWATPNITPIESAILWENLRDALGLPKGTATEAGVGS